MSCLGGRATTPNARAHPPEPGWTGTKCLRRARRGHFVSSGPPTVALQVATATWLPHGICRSDSVDRRQPVYLGTPVDLRRVHPRGCASVRGIVATAALPGMT